MFYNLYFKDQNENKRDYFKSIDNYVITMTDNNGSSMERNLAVAEDNITKVNGKFIDTVKDGLFLNLLFFYKFEPNFITSSITETFNEFDYMYHFSKSKYAKLLKDVQKNNDIEMNYKDIFKINSNYAEAMPVIINNEHICSANYTLFARNNSKLFQYNFSKYNKHDNKVNFEKGSLACYDNKFSLAEWAGINKNDIVLKNNMSAEDISNLDSYDNVNVYFATPAGNYYYLVIYNYGFNCAKYDIDFKDFQNDYNPAGYYFYAKSKKLQDKILEVAAQAKEKTLKETIEYMKKKCC